jgi:hypothetical protein
MMIVLNEDINFLFKIMLNSKQSSIIKKNKKEFMELQNKCSIKYIFDD